MIVSARNADGVGAPKIPLAGLKRHRGSWANLSVDLAGLTLMCFKSDAFRTLDLLAIGPTCRVRKIFTMRGALSDQSDQGNEGTGGRRAQTGCTVRKK